MTKETKIKILQGIVNAGLKGTDREMLDNLKAVIRAIEDESPLLHQTKESIEHMKKVCVPEGIGILPKRKAGRPPKKR